MELESAAILEHDPHGLIYGVHNPIFPNPCPLVQSQLYKLIVPLCGWGQDLYLERGRLKKSLAFHRVKVYNGSSSYHNGAARLWRGLQSTISEVLSMTLSHTHSFTFTYGWTRFTVSGYFDVEKRGA